MKNLKLKYFLWAAIVLFVIFFLNKIITALKGVFGNEAEKEQKIQQTTDTVSNTKVLQSSLKHPASFYLSLANRIEDGMQTLGTWGFDNMYKELSVLNTEELKQVYKVFGIRKNKTFAGLSSMTGDLFEWFNDELSTFAITGDSELNKMKKLFAKTKLWV